MVQRKKGNGANGAGRTAQVNGNGRGNGAGVNGNGTAQVNGNGKVSPPAVPAPPTGAELAALRGTLKHGPYTGGTKPTTKVFTVHEGKIHTGTIAGHPADGTPAALHEFVWAAPVVKLTGPTGGEFVDPKTGNPKSAGTTTDVPPGTSVYPFLADLILPVS